MKLILRFRKLGVKPADYFDKIEDAIFNASFNLYSRNNIKLALGDIECFDDYIVIPFSLVRDKKEVSTMNFRGIGRYLLATYPETFNELKVGTSLFELFILEDLKCEERK